MVTEVMVLWWCYGGLIESGCKWASVQTQPPRQPSSSSIQSHLGRDTRAWELVSNNGTHITSEAFGEYLRRVGRRHNLVTPSHPAGSGAVERANRTVKAALQAGDRNGENIEKVAEGFPSAVPGHAACDDGNQSV